LISINRLSRERKKLKPRPPARCRRGATANP
jgi:hypothetical protein